MRRTLLALALALAVFSLAACSSDPVTVSGTDAAADVGAPPKDAGKDGTSPDATTQNDGSTPNDASVTDVFIPPDAVSLTCQSPGDCGDAGTSICCATLVSGAGNPPNCPIKSLTSSCKATCATAITLTCNGTSTVRACTQNADCTEATYGKCCTFDGGNNNTATFCASVGISQFALSCK